MYFTESGRSQHLQCMINYTELSNSSLAPAKLKVLNVHGNGKYKSTMLAEFKMKRARFDENAT